MPHLSLRPRPWSILLVAALCQAGCKDPNDYTCTLTIRDSAGTVVDTQTLMYPHEEAADAQAATDLCEAEGADAVSAGGMFTCSCKSD